MGYQLWVLIGECDRDFPCRMKSNLTNPVAVSYRPTFSQRVSDIVIRCNELADQMGLSCMAMIHNALNPKVSHAIHRCDKTAFLHVLAFMGTTLLAQVVLTLRFAALGMSQLRANHH